MLLAEFNFLPRKFTPADCQELEAAVQTWLLELGRGGNVWSHLPPTWLAERLQVVALVPTHQALNANYLTQTTRDCETKLRALLREEVLPILSVRGDHGRRRSCNLRRTNTLYLFTSAEEVAIPIWSGDNGTPLPHYQLNLSDKHRHELFNWLQHWQQVERQWLASGGKAESALEQLADPTSELAIQGRLLGEVVQSATGRPTYYSLLRTSALAELRQLELLAHEIPKCSSCGKPMQAEAHAPDRQEGLSWFAFRCEPCRLVYASLENATYDRTIARELAAEFVGLALTPVHAAADKHPN